MWIDEIPSNRGWGSLWHDQVLCQCGGIRLIELPCPVCNEPPYDCRQRTVILENGGTIEVPVAFRGAEGRYEDYMYLQLMEREWMRPILSETGNFSLLSGTSDKVSIVLLFWTYFETRIERLLRIGLSGTPNNLAEDALDRYSSIGTRLDKFYKVVFNTTYQKDLQSLERHDLWLHLKEIQKKRNEFIHGNPKAIDDALILRVVENIKIEHESWVKIFNKRLGLMRTQ